MLQEPLGDGRTWGSLYVTAANVVCSAGIRVLLHEYVLVFEVKWPEADGIRIDPPAPFLEKQVVAKPVRKIGKVLKLLNVGFRNYLVGVFYDGPFGYSFAWTV